MSSTTSTIASPGREATFTDPHRRSSSAGRQPTSWTPAPAPSARVAQTPAETGTGASAGPVSDVPAGVIAAPASVPNPGAPRDSLKARRSGGRRELPRKRAAWTRARARWSASLAAGRDAGLATAEYAVVLIAAVGFAVLLVVILSSNEVRETLLGLVQKALSV